MGILDFNDNTFARRARRMHDNRKVCGLPSSIPYCMRVMDPECQLTECQVNTLQKTISKF